MDYTSATLNFLAVFEDLDLGPDEMEVDILTDEEMEIEVEEEEMDLDLAPESTAIEPMEVDSESEILFPLLIFLFFFVLLSG